MFQKKLKSKAMDLYGDIAHFVTSITVDKEVFPEGGRDRGVGSIVMALCCFLTVGFLSKSDPKFFVAQEILLIHKKNLLDDEVPIKEADEVIRFINDIYLNFREVAIKTQEKSSNNFEIIVKSLANLTAEYFDIDNTETANKAIQGYIITFISNHT